VAEVQQTRWDRLLRRVSGSVGTRSHVSETLTELFPVLDVESVPGELLLLAGTRLSHGGGVIVGIAPDIPKCQLFNPPDSGHLVTITSVIMSTQVADTLVWGVSPNVLAAGIGTETFRDFRLLVPQQPVAGIFQEADTVIATATNQARLTPNQAFQITDPNGVAVLAPGTGLEFGLNAAGNTLFFTFSWREREALPSELQF